MENLRSKYRNVHKEICNHFDDTANVPKVDELKDEYKGMLKTIKSVLSEAKNVKSALQNTEADKLAVKEADREKLKWEEMAHKASSVTFLLVDIERLFSSIYEDINLDNISSDRNVVDDDELLEMRSRLPSLQLRIENLSSRTKELIGLVTDPTDANMKNVRTIGRKFDEMLQDRASYVETLKDEIRVRECSKEKRFQSSSMNINLPRFKGYDSVLDFYSFKSKFILRHSQDVPEKAQAEFLKNNYLEGPALESVKRLKTIHEIWKTLQKEFGDPRVMLSKKMSELDSVGALGKTRDAEKIKDGLNKVVNLMQELMTLAADHGIEERLYWGGTINSIYRTIGDIRTTKFIEKNCEFRLEGEVLWKELVKFLEKEIKVQLEKSMIYRTFNENNSNERRSHNNNDGQSHLTQYEQQQPLEEQQQQQNSDEMNASSSDIMHSDNRENSSGSNRDNSSGSNRDRNEKVCHLCSKTDHIATEGPYGKKLIQYFSCKEFVDASCAQRFAKLRQKGFCTQCLMPGAKSSTQKHAEGRCQNVYICAHESHNAFAMKKHVLVCEEHKDLDANKTLLEQYRARCINRSCNTDLPEYSRSIHLAYHCVHLTQNTLDAANVGRGIYQFQQIKVVSDAGEDEDVFTLFFDNGCRDAVLTIDAAERLDRLKRVLKTKEGKVALGGVGGGIAVESSHGERQLSLPLAKGGNAIIGGQVIDHTSFRCMH